MLYRQYGPAQTPSGPFEGTENPTMRRQQAPPRTAPHVTLFTENPVDQDTASQAANYREANPTPQFTPIS